MKKTLKEKITDFQDKELEISQLDEEIHRLEQELIRPLKEAKQQRMAELEAMGKEPTINISVKDLVKELSVLTNTPEDEIYVDVDYFGIWTAQDYNQDDFAKKRKNPQLNIIITNTSPQELSKNNPKDGDFYYNISFISDFRELQADGKSLIEHSYTISSHADGLPWHRIETSIYIKEEDIMDIICHFRLWDIARNYESEGYYYPKNLLGQALQNYEKRKREAAKVKLNKLTL